jgi:glycosyltransferase involved in cell wall biosynthesis
VNEDTILFLYTRLPDYTYKCVEHFVHLYGGKVVIIRYKEDVNTKYHFSENDKISLIYKDDNIRSVIASIDPKAIVISGWGDKEYVSIAKKYVSRIPVVLSIDNPWTGSLKQKVLSLSSFYIHRFFNRVWVAGIPQHEYARRLGFKNNQIYTNLYSADTQKFYNVSDYALQQKSKTYPRNLVYVGRLVKYKQPHILAKVFHEITSKTNLNWKLIIAGAGPLKEQIILGQYKNVVVRDFIDPAELADFYMNAGVFCLPSNNEHWGVAVHEASAAGLPLLLSDSTGAGTEFLINHFNGLVFKSGDESSLRENLLKIMGMTDEELIVMGKNSLLLSQRISHSTWSANLNSILKS